MRMAFCDGLGVVCSIGCAVHCAAMPFVIAWLPTLGAEWLAGEQFHVWMAAACFAIAIAAVLPGYFRHRRLAVPMLAGIGVSALVAALFLTPSDCCAAADNSSVATPTTSDCCESATSAVADCCESAQTTADCCESAAPTLTVTAAPAEGTSPLVSWLTPMGGLLLVSAHLLNRRECKCCSSNVGKTKSGTTVEASTC